MSPGSTSAKLFINYRREDAAPYAGRLYDRLTAHFGEGQVFIDIDQIEPGEDFVEAINRKVGTCDIAVVAIGPTGSMQPMRRVSVASTTKRILSAWRSSLRSSAKFASFQSLLAEHGCRGGRIFQER